MGADGVDVERVLLEPVPQVDGPRLFQADPVEGVGRPFDPTEFLGRPPAAEVPHEHGVPGQEPPEVRRQLGGLSLGRDLIHSRAAFAVPPVGRHG